MDENFWMTMFGLVGALILLIGFAQCIEKAEVEVHCLEWKTTDRTICTGNQWKKICEPEKVCVRRAP